MSATEKDVATCLLGTWPNQVAAWGREGIAAYIAELDARGVTPEQALTAIRSYNPDADFPPSVAKLAQQARTDPGAPTFLEMLRLVNGPGGVLAARLPVGGGPYDSEAAMIRARNQARLARARELHPLVGVFVERYGIDKLARLELDDPEFGEVRRRDLERAWNEHCKAMEGRDIAALVAGPQRGSLGRLDPLAALGVTQPQIGRAA